jgi:hypothetical protein|nr:MAG TPA: hypothetical protein [Caudoviricetes sp.]
MPRALNDYNADRAESSKKKDDKKPFVQPRKVAMHISSMAPGWEAQKRKQVDTHTQ